MKFSAEIENVIIYYYTEMPYGKVYKLLTQGHGNSGDVVLIESPFLETTRLGTRIRCVLLGKYQGFLNLILNPTFRIVPFVH